MLFIEYPKCSTCKKAKKYLLDHNTVFEERDIVLETPTKEELGNYLATYNIDISKLFNTSGIKYRELNLKEKQKEMSLNEKLDLLASDGMLIKRPLVIASDKILIGFREKEWDKYFKEEEK